MSTAYEKKTGLRFTNCVHATNSFAEASGGVASLVGLLEAAVLPLGQVGYQEEVEALPCGCTVAPIPGGIPIPLPPRRGVSILHLDPISGTTWSRFSRCTKQHSQRQIETDSCGQLVGKAALGPLLSKRKARL
jgi:hypothetical protein